MPRKRLQHKGKSKHTSDIHGDFLEKISEEETLSNDYKTIVDSEINKKYSKRAIEPNWLKYEEFNVESEDEKNVLPKTDDFSHLISTASTDCSYFQFNAEKLWKKEENFVPPSNIFDLDLNMLSSGLACIPFYERIGLDEKYLSADDKQRLDAAAERNWKEYNLTREKSYKKINEELSDKKSEDLNILNNILKDLKVETVETKTPEKSIVIVETPRSVKADHVKKVEGAEKIEEIKHLFFSENDEDLEIWLDSVLDD